MTSFFYSQIEENSKNNGLLKEIDYYVKLTKNQIFLINKPLGEKKYNYDYENNIIIVLSPKHKILIINFDKDREDDFEDFMEDFMEDLGSLSDKYGYREYIGRPRKWREQMVESIAYNSKFNFKEYLAEIEFHDDYLKRKCELLISLLTGSINDIEKVKDGVPETLLDKVKNKILLFDGDQTRFIYQEKLAPRINIQGLSGTGKTELLLHKLKELYVNEKDSKIIFTCFNKILASNLRSRIPEFFTFMRIEEQIKWDERLWCTHAWGSRTNINSGVYRYICDFYDLNFYTYNFKMTFDKACLLAIEELNKTDLKSYGFAFDYILIDECQDFPESFFNLCEIVTKNTVYVAGDIFQDIFDNNIENTANADYLLSRCYRTDPRTLMFAHSLGMGLFESPKLNWLSDTEWNACGYIITRNEPVVMLEREPLRRFEDLDIDDFNSMEIVIRKENSIDKINKNIIDIIANINNEHPTVKAEDVAVIFIDEDKYIYEVADRLEMLIDKNFDWKVNKAYESKEKLKNSVFVSNKNNVKGLEFPFVICVVNSLENNLKYRNALYMMLTRSFIKSYLLVPEFVDMSLINKGLDNINQTKKIITTQPSDEEISSMKKFIIKYKKESNKSFYDFVTEIFEDKEINSLHRNKLLPIIQQINGEKFNKEHIIKIIDANMGLI